MRSCDERMSGSSEASRRALGSIEDLFGEKEAKSSLAADV